MQMLKVTILPEEWTNATPNQRKVIRDALEARYGEVLANHLDSIERTCNDLYHVFYGEKETT